MKNVSFEDMNLSVHSSISPISFAQPFKFEIKDFIQEEFYNINNIIATLSKGVFSSSLVSSVVKSTLVYQYLQAEVVTVLQKNFDEELAQTFIEKTKVAIKTIVDYLQKNKLI